MMALIYVISLISLDFLNLVEAKTCLRSDSLTETFTCGMYEYCCGTRCCRSPIITFYQMWYFWLMVFLTLLFCSGSGWWYRLRNQDTFIAPSRITQARPVIQTARGPTVYASSMPMPATSGVAQYPRTSQMPQYPVSSQVPQYTAVPQVPQYSAAPPPYYGPPPSYDAVVNLNNQNVQHQNNQNIQFQR